MRALWYILFPAYFLIVGCHNPCPPNPSCPSPDEGCHVEYGFCVVEDMGLTTGHVRQVFDLTVQEFARFYSLPVAGVFSDTVDYLQDWVVQPVKPEVRGDRLCVPGYSDVCGWGITDPVIQEIFIAYREGLCLYGSALSHEFLHILFGAVWGDMDKEHTATEVWQLDWNVIKWGISDLQCPDCIDDIDAGKEECYY